MADLLAYPWANARVPPRLTARFPRAPVRAGRFDDLTGDFVPAVELDVPMQLPAILAGTDVLAFGTFCMVERNLAVRRLICLLTLEFDIRGSYRFIFRRNRLGSPAARAYMQAVRDVEQRIIEREAELEQLHGPRPCAPRGSVNVKRPDSAQHRRGDLGTAAALQNT